MDLRIHNCSFEVQHGVDQSPRSASGSTARVGNRSGPTVSPKRGCEQESIVSRSKKRQSSPTHKKTSWNVVFQLPRRNGENRSQPTRNRLVAIFEIWALQWATWRLNLFVSLSVRTFFQSDSFRFGLVLYFPCVLCFFLVHLGVCTICSTISRHHVVFATMLMSLLLTTCWAGCDSTCCSVS